MARSHTHRDGGPPCSFTTKRECDAHWREHVLQRKIKYEQEQAERTKREKEARIKRFDAFITSEKARAESLSKEPVTP